MRTSFDLPDALYRTLKARAATSGLKVRELVIRYLEEGLGRPVQPSRTTPRAEPPVMIPASGHVIPALTRDRLARIEQAEDEARHGRSARR